MPAATLGLRLNDRQTCNRLLPALTGFLLWMGVVYRDLFSTKGLKLKWHCFSGALKAANEIIGENWLLEELPGSARYGALPQHVVP